MSARVSYEDTYPVFLDLIRKGESPSVQNARGILGRGSFSTLGKHRERFLREMADSAGAGIPVGVPEELTGAVESLWQAAREHAVEMLRGEREAMAERIRKADEAVESHAQATQALQDQVESLTRRIEGLTEENHEAHEEIERLTEARDVAENLAAQREAEVASGRQEAASAIRAARIAHRREADALKAQIAERDEHLARERERGEAQERHWIEQIEKTRAEHRWNEAQSRERIEKLEEALSAERKARSEAETEIGRLRGALETSEKSAEREQTRLQKALDETRGKIDELGERMATSERELTEVKREHDLEQQRTSRLESVAEMTMHHLNVLANPPKPGSRAAKEADAVRVRLERALAEQGYHVDGRGDAEEDDDGPSPS